MKGLLNKVVPSANKIKTEFCEWALKAFVLMSNSELGALDRCGSPTRTFRLPLILCYFYSFYSVVRDTVNAMRVMLGLLYWTSYQMLSIFSQGSHSPTYASWNLLPSLQPDTCELWCWGLRHTRKGPASWSVTTKCHCFFPKYYTFNL